MCKKKWSCAVLDAEARRPPLIHPLSYSPFPNWRGELQAERLFDVRDDERRALSPSPTVYFCCSLQPSHALHTYEPNHSLAKQWHAQRLFLPRLRSPSPGLSLRLLVPSPASVSFHAAPVPPLFFFHSAIVSGVNISCHTLHPWLILMQPNKMMHPVDTQASSEAEGRLAGRWNLG